MLYMRTCRAAFPFGNAAVLGFAPLASTYTRLRTLKGLSMSRLKQLDKRNTGTDEGGKLDGHTLPQQGKLDIDTLFKSH